MLSSHLDSSKQQWEDDDDNSDSAKAWKLGQLQPRKCMSDKWRVGGAGGHVRPAGYRLKPGRKRGFWGKTAAQQEEMVNQVGQAAASQTLT